MHERLLVAPLHSFLSSEISHLLFRAQWQLLAGGTNWNLTMQPLPAKHPTYDLYSFPLQSFMPYMNPYILAFNTQPSSSQHVDNYRPYRTIVPSHYLKMLKPIYLLLCLLLSLRATVARPSYSKFPQRPLSFSPPSQYPILYHQPSLNENLSFHGTINVSSYGLDQPARVTYSLSSQICIPLVPEVLYIINDLSRWLLSQDLDSTAFNILSDTPRSPLPVYLAVNITEQLYRSKFILGLSLQLVLLDTNPEEQVILPWESIIAFLEQSALELDRAARKRNGAGLGSISVLEAQIVGVGVLAEWRFWSVVDGITTTCEG